MSYDALHLLNKKALLNQIFIDKLALALFKMYNFRLPQFEWISLDFSQILITRQVIFEVSNTPHYRVENNILTNF